MSILRRSFFSKAKECSWFGGMLISSFESVELMDMGIEVSWASWAFSSVAIVYIWVKRTEGSKCSGI